MAACEQVVAVDRTAPGGGPLHTRARRAVALATRTPAWAREWDVPAYDRVLRETLAAFRPELVQLHYHVMGRYLRTLRAWECPRVLVQYESGSRRARDDRRARSRRGLRGAVDAAELRAWRRLERSVIRDVDAVVAFSQEDRAEIEALVPDARATVVPLGIRIPDRPADPVGEEGFVLFAGSFAHFPNVEAAGRLLRSIFPLVAARAPEARLHLVGPGLPDEIAALARDRVDVEGHVADLGPYLERAAVVTAPLHVGGGTRVKVLDALAAGKAVVSSRRAIEGLPEGAADCVRVADTDEAAAAAIAELLSRPEERRRLGARARAWAEENLSWEARLDAYDALHAELVDGRS